MSDKYLKLFQSLLSTGRAWSLNFNKQIEQFFSGLSKKPQQVEDTFGQIYYDLFPSSTNVLTTWEEAFGLDTNDTLTEAQRRLRLAARWRARGGQSPHYFKEVLNLGGYPVYVYEWWERSPKLVDIQFGKTYHCNGQALDCGDKEYQFGDGTQFGQKELTTLSQRDPHDFEGDYPYQFGDGHQFGDDIEFSPKGGIVLVNGIQPISSIPYDHRTWMNVWYLAGPDIHTIVRISKEREYDFLNLVSKIKPAQSWVVLNVYFE